MENEFRGDNICHRFRPANRQAGQREEKTAHSQLRGEASSLCLAFPARHAPAAKCSLAQLGVSLPIVRFFYESFAGMAGEGWHRRLLALLA